MSQEKAPDPSTGSKRVWVACDLHVKTPSEIVASVWGVPAFTGTPQIHINFKMVANTSCFLLFTRTHLAPLLIHANAACGML